MAWGYSHTLYVSVLMFILFICLFFKIFSGKRFRSFNFSVNLQVPVYIAEIAPQNLRGSLGSVNQVCMLNGLFQLPFGVIYDLCYYKLQSIDILVYFIIFYCSSQ